MTENEVVDGGIISLVLPSILDFSSCGALYSELVDHVGSDVVVDGSCVRHLGAPCVQVLLSASRSWGAQGVGFVVDPRSDAFVAGLDRMGIGADELPGFGAVSGPVSGPVSGAV